VVVFTDHSYTDIPTLAILLHDSDHLSSLDSPGGFFIQIFRLSVSLCVLIVLLALYNSVRVLGRTILCTATCSLYWVLVVAMVALKAALLIVFAPLSTKKDIDTSSINQAGFILITAVQSAVVYLTFVSLDHERKFRSPDFASVDSPFKGRNCIPATWDKLILSWYRLAVLPLPLLPLALLIAIEITFSEDSSHQASSVLVWVFFATLLFPRVAVMVMTVFLFRAKELLRPTFLAKVYLSAALVLSLLEEVPNSVLTVAHYFNSSHSEMEACDKACQLVYLTVYDLFQILGGLSLVFYLLFIRSQYLRVEQECKLAMVWDLQKLLQVNGRANQDVAT